jgi:thymidylate kinase
VKKWDRVLKQQAQSHPGTILLDHGPIFKLATLHAFGPGWLRSDAADAWWQELFQRWAALLDLVIWLDAPDDLLETRINARAQKHPVKGRSGQEVTRFLEAYRSSYQYVLSKLAASGRPDIVRFDTGQAAMEQVTDEALATCQREAAGS